MSYELEVVETRGACCSNTRSLDHFCGSGSPVKKGMTSRCNECGKEVRAEAWKSNDDPPRIYLRKYCPEHGTTSSRASSDAAFYYLSDSGEACGCGPGGCGPSALGANATFSSTLHTCTLVMEIVADCNLACPTCYADSPQRASEAHAMNLSFDAIRERISGVLDRQDKIDILQLSGGEPTLHPQFLDIVKWAAEEPRIESVLLNTNGIRLSDPPFAEALAGVVPKGKFGVYLQYDGVGAKGQKELRSGDFRPVREKVLDNCRTLGLRVALVMTVTHENKFGCAETLDKALADDNIPWVVFQPEFLSGRNDKRKLLENPVNVADVVHSVARGGRMDLASWIPLPCSDPNCGTVGFMVRVGGEWQSASRFVDLPMLAPLIANRINYDVDAPACGCDQYELAAHLEKYGVAREDVKMVFIKPFMDARTWDAARIASCCTHVLTPEGKVDSFCRYYGTK